MANNIKFERAAYYAGAELIPFGDGWHVSVTEFKDAPAVNVR
jgi:hypothetical protein